jgi:hypothetical protein
MKFVKTGLGWTRQAWGDRRGEGVADRFADQTRFSSAAESGSWNGLGIGGEMAKCGRIAEE